MIELVFAQFGEKSATVEPSLNSFKKYFPEAKTTLFTDCSMLAIDGIDEVRVVIPPYIKSDPRYGNRSNDLYKGIGLLESKAELAIALDNDMLVVSKDVQTLIPLTQRFGLCLAANPRSLVRIDALIGADGSSLLDETNGSGQALNMSPIAFSTRHTPTRDLLHIYCNEMTTRPVRGPLAMWRAIWRSGFNPYVLPLQWCVCSEHCGIENEIILHVGHEEVKKFYGQSVSQQGANRDFETRKGHGLSPLHTVAGMISRLGEFWRKPHMDDILRYEFYFWKTHGVPNEGESFYRKNYGVRLRELDSLFRLPTFPDVAVDVGCGPFGGMSLVYAAKNFILVDPLLDEYIHMVPRKDAFAYLTCFGEAIDLEDGVADVVFCCNALDHTEDRLRCLTEIHRILKNDGLFCLWVHCRKENELNEGHKQAFSPVQLADELKAVGFSIIAHKVGWDTYETFVGVMKRV